MKKELMLLLIFLLAFQLSAFNAIAKKTGYYAKGGFNKDALTSKENAFEASNDLLQFRSGSFILGFKPDKIYMAGMGYMLTEEFIGTEGAVPVLADIQGQKNNRFIKGAREFKKVSYPNLWPGITVNYEAKHGGVAESTYIIEPQADVSRIRLKYNGEAKIQKDGSLRFNHPAEKGCFTMTAPIAWQEMEGKKIKVSVAFNEYKDNTILDYHIELSTNTLFMQFLSRSD